MGVKVVFLKTKGQVCNNCYHIDRNRWIEKSELSVRMRYVDAGGFFHIYHWHLDCYVKHIEEKIKRKSESLLLRKEEAIKHEEEKKREKKPRGRPKKLRGKPGRPSKAPLAAKRRRAKLSLLIYHKKKGHTDRVDALEKEMRVLENLGA